MLAALEWDGPNWVLIVRGPGQVLSWYGASGGLPSDTGNWSGWEFCGRPHFIPDQETDFCEEFSSSRSHSREPVHTRGSFHLAA